MQKIVIIGGGYTGTIAAINLARLSSIPLHICIVNKNKVPSRGIAYNTQNGSHLLNVAARNMSALADQPNHFVEWLGTRSEYLDESVTAVREKFVPRRVYGDYLQSLFQWFSAILAVEKNMRLEFIHAEAEAILTERLHVKITLVGGEVLAADKVILALGNKAPSLFHLRGLDYKSSRYIGNPWIDWERRLPSPDENLLLIGTGLTMVDTVLTLLDLKWRGKIYASSRNGLLPLSHFKGFEYPDFLDGINPNISLRKIYALFKKHFRIAKSRNLNPAILVDKLRPYTQRIWQNFSLFEKRQFNRHLRTRWNVMRHRIAPEIHNRLQTAIADGRLEVIKGRLRSNEESSDKMVIEIETLGIKRSLEVGSVINCTGPQESCFPAETSLFDSLFAKGAIQADEMNMGIKVSPNFSVLDRQGNPSNVLFALGSLLKGTFWESVAVPELRSQAFRVAEGIAAKKTISEVVEDVWEYSI